MNPMAHGAMKIAAAIRRRVAVRLRRLRGRGVVVDATSCRSAPVLIARLVAEVRLVVDLVSDAWEPRLQRATLSGQILAEPLDEGVNVCRPQRRQLLVP